ncbi:MAG: T9SS type A sorting domain-containing protein [Bacteroidota bacterium]
MKAPYLILFGFLICGLRVQAQHYQAFYPDSTRIYRQGTDLFTMGQTGISPNDSNMYRGYHIMEHDSDHCPPDSPFSYPVANPYAVSWMGDSVLVLDSMTIFYAKDGWPIRFPTHLSSGQSWEMAVDTGGRKYMALVNTLNNESFLDVSDSVATIGISVLDPNGIPIPAHPISSVKIKLSKHHGFVQCLPWGRFPEDTNLYSLTPRGLMTYGEAYNLAVGDHFQTYIEFSYPTYCSIWDYRVITKSWSGGQDSLFYQIRRARTDIVPNDPQVYHEVDTLDWTFTTAMLASLIESRFPWQTYSVVGGVGDLRYSAYNEVYGCIARLAPKANKGVLYWQNGSDSCLNHRPSASTGGLMVYLEGLGNVWQHRDWEGILYEEEVVYYHKSTGSWGDPILNVDNDLAGQFALRVGPNPAREQLSIWLNLSERSEVQFYLTDFQGKTISRIREEMLSAGEHIFYQDLNRLPEGLYLLHLGVGDQKVIRKIWHR